MTGNSRTSAVSANDSRSRDNAHRSEQSGTLSTAVPTSLHSPAHLSPQFHSPVDLELSMPESVSSYSSDFEMGVDDSDSALVVEAEGNGENKNKNKTPIPSAATPSILPDDDRNRGSKTKTKPISSDTSDIELFAAKEALAGAVDDNRKLRAALQGLEIEKVSTAARVQHETDRMARELETLRAENITLKEEINIAVEDFKLLHQCLTTGQRLARSLERNTGSIDPSPFAVALATSTSAPASTSSSLTLLQRPLFPLVSSADPVHAAVLSGSTQVMEDLLLQVQSAQESVLQLRHQLISKESDLHLCQEELEIVKAARRAAVPLTEPPATSTLPTHNDNDLPWMQRARDLAASGGDVTSLESDLMEALHLVMQLQQRQAQWEGSVREVDAHVQWWKEKYENVQRGQESLLEDSMTARKHRQAYKHLYQRYEGKKARIVALEAEMEGLQKELAVAEAQTTRMGGEIRGALRAAANGEASAAHRLEQQLQAALSECAEWKENYEEVKAHWEDAHLQLVKSGEEKERLQLQKEQLQLDLTRLGKGSLGQATAHNPRQRPTSASTPRTPGGLKSPSTSTSTAAAASSSSTIHREMTQLKQFHAEQIAGLRQKVAEQIERKEKYCAELNRWRKDAKKYKHLYQKGQENLEQERHQRMAMEIQLYNVLKVREQEGIMMSELQKQLGEAEAQSEHFYQNCITVELTKLRQLEQSRKEK